MKNNTCLRGRTVVITGAGSGIGRELALQLADQGARLALSDVNTDGLQETLRLLVPGSEAKGYQLDVSSRDAVRKHASDVLRDFGNVHLLINNAGVTLVGSVAQTSIEEFEWLMGINLWGVIYTTKAFLPAMLEQRDGCIVNISSVFGLIGFPLQGAYNVTKFGVRGFTECLWSELEGTGVRAVSVHPGGIRTNIDHSARLAAAADPEASVTDMFGKLNLATPPQQCAAEIIQGIRKGRRLILTGHKSRTLQWLARLLPERYPSLIKMRGRSR